MLIFVSGQHPILGTQMLYFLDPKLKAWSEMPAPSHLVSIQGEQIVPLIPALKANSSTNKSTPQSEDAEMLQMEKAFIEDRRKHMEVYDYAA
jgi:hypothetical protein